MSTALAVFNPSNAIMAGKELKNGRTDKARPLSIKEFASTRGQSIKDVRASGAYASYHKQFGAVAELAVAQARQFGLTNPTVTVKQDDEGNPVTITVKMDAPKGMETTDSVIARLRKEISEARAEREALLAKYAADEAAE